MAAHAIATHHTNSNAALLCLLRNLKKKLTGVGYTEFLCFSVDSNGFGNKETTCSGGGD